MVDGSPQTAATSTDLAGDGGPQLGAHGVVVVHGVSDGMKQGDFLVDVVEPVFDWMAEAGTEFEARRGVNVRRGPHPPTFDAVASLPRSMSNAARPAAPAASGAPSGAPAEAEAGAGQDRTRIHWRFYEAMWSDEHREPSPARALLWWVRAMPMFVIDHLSYYDATWRLRWADFRTPGDSAQARARQYHYNLRWTVLRKSWYWLVFAFVIPIFAVAAYAAVVVPLTGLWMLIQLGRLLLWSGAGGGSPDWLTRMVASYWNLAYRMLLVVAWLPLLVVGWLLIVVLWMLSHVPVKIPQASKTTDLVVRFIQFRFGDMLIYNRDLVASGSIHRAVVSVLQKAIEECHGSLTVIAHSQGCVVAYEAIAHLAAQGKLRRVTFVTAGSMINHTYGWPWEFRSRGRSHKRVPGRDLMTRPLPDGTRWVDIYALHDPAPMGALNGELAETSGAAVHDVAVKNTLTHVSAHTTYWPNNVEVISVIADELLHRALSNRARGGSDATQQRWTNPRAGNGFEQPHADRRGLAVHAERGLYTLRQVSVAAVRGIAYLTVIAFAVWLIVGGQQADKAVAWTDERPVLQTPLRWFWAPITFTASPPNLDAVIRAARAGGSTVIQFDEAAGRPFGTLDSTAPSGPDVRNWKLMGPGELLG